MFTKVLIANRGEIACRIMRTLRKMGIGSVAVYSAADEDALHVRMADEAYPIGPAPVRESYLNISAILEAAKLSGAQAIHPGYGFLSENAEFAEAVGKAALVFIGPSPSAIALMGDKIEAKKLALQAGVPCMVSCDDPYGDLSSISYPLLVKAAAGGGGKGMRIIYDPSHLEEGLKGAIHEAESSFGDGRVFIEQYIENARHIEFQILGDTHGNIIHLGERECSLQRRHQKVIEETPSPFMTQELRDAMAEAALGLAKAVSYSSAGTVEFVVDPKRNFFFLEMNTRLQVEHPVTEMVTGIDLVEQMIRIAAGEKLSLNQSDIQFKGHAIEARVYAEDSARGFLPSSGRLKTCLEPPQLEGEPRLETGAGEGDSISPYYDPMIAKLIVHEANRKLATDVLISSLDRYYIRGVETNISFLSHLLDSKEFRSGDINTTFLDENYEKGFIPTLPENPIVAVGTAAAMHIIKQGLDQEEMTVLINRDSYPVSVVLENHRIEIKGKESLIIETKWKPGDMLFEGAFNGHQITLQIDHHGSGTKLSWNGYGVTTLVLDAATAELYTRMPLKQLSDMSRIIQAPMPGLIVEIFVKEGDSIKAGQPAFIIEAMKMENIIRAEVDGAIEKIYVKQGESVNSDQHLAKIG